LAKHSKDDVKLFESRLRSHEYAGHIIQWVSIFESTLDITLAIYFVNPVSTDKRDPTSVFLEQVLSKLSFASKIDTLKNLQFAKPLKSQEGITTTLDKLRKLRNVLAHTHYLSDRDILKLRSDAWIFNFVIQYPSSIGKEKNALENRFNHLWNSCMRIHDKNMSADSVFIKRHY